MSLPYFVESGDYIVSPQCIARLRRATRDGSPVVLVRFRSGCDAPDEEVSGPDGERLFEAFRAFSSSPRLPASPDPSPGAGPGSLDAIDSTGDTPGVIREAPGHEASGTE